MAMLNLDLVKTLAYPYKFEIQKSMLIKFAEDKISKNLHCIERKIARMKFKILSEAILA